MKKWGRNILIAIFTLGFFLSPFSIETNFYHDNNPPNKSLFELKKGTVAANPAATFGTDYSGTYQGTDLEALNKQQEDRDSKGFFSELTDKITGGLNEFGGSLLEIAGSVVFRVIRAVLLIVYSVASFVVYLAGFLFNISIILTVSRIGTLIPVETINATWVIFRDIANTLFVFALLYAGVRTIIGNYSSTIQKLIVMTVISAVFVNFSLFITKAVVDVSNIVSLGIYNEIIDNGERAATDALDGGEDNIAHVFTLAANSNGGGLAGAYLEAFAVTKTLQPFDEAGSAETFLEGVGTVQQDLGTITNLFISIYALIAAAILLLFSGLMFIARYVFIIILMIFSPVYFAGLIIPQIGKLKDLWYKNLVKNLIFPPIFFLLIFVSLELIGAINKNLDTATAVGAFDNNVKNDPTVLLTIVFSSILGIFFLGLPLYLSKMVGDSIVGFEKLQKSFQPIIDAPRKFAVDRINASGSLLARNSLGNAARRFESSNFVKQSAFFNSGVGRTLREQTTQSLQDATFGGKFSATSVINEKRDQATKRREGAEAAEFKNNMKEYEADKAIIENDTVPLTNQDKQAAIARMERNKEMVANMNTDQILNQATLFESDRRYADLLSDSKLEELKKDDLTRPLAEGVAQKRLEGVREELNKSTPSADDLDVVIKNLPSKGTLGELSTEEKMRLTEIAGSKIKGKVFEGMMKGMNDDAKEALEIALVDSITQSVSDIDNILDSKDSYDKATEGLSGKAKSELNKKLAAHLTERDPSTSKLKNITKVLDNKEVYKEIVKDRKVNKADIMRDLGIHLRSEPGDVAKVSPKDISDLPNEILKEPAIIAKMTTSQIESIGKNVTDRSVLSEIKREVTRTGNHAADAYVTTGAGADYFKI